MRNLKNRILEVIAPRHCFICGRPSPSPAPYTCKSCSGNYELITVSSCVRCGFPFFGTVGSEKTCSTCSEHLPQTDSGKALFLHRGTGSALIQELKYFHGIFLFSEICYLLGKRLDLEDYFKNTVLIPVPLHPRKFRERGYNQAEIVAESIVEVYPCKLQADLIERKTDGRSQTFLTRKERKKNVKGVFAVKKETGIDPEMNYVLVDDVFTTGSTLDELCRILKNRGAKKVKSFTLAHG